MAIFFDTPILSNPNVSGNWMKRVMLPNISDTTATTAVIYLTHDDVR